MSVSDRPPTDAGLFGTDFDPDGDTVVVIGVPWEPTTSYGRGTSRAPGRMAAASHQLDFYMPAIDRTFGERVGMAPLEPLWLERNQRCVAWVDQVRKAPDPTLLAEINRASADLNRELYELTSTWLDHGKRTGVLGGDHASPLGHMRACLERHPGSSVLQIDAHHDLRIAYEGFTYSHASIMYNLLQEIPQVGGLVSVGIRDYSEEERRFAESHSKITTFYDRDLAFAAASGRTWREQVQAILGCLAETVYISFDIDGLRPDLCPHTGTPVPGGLDWHQVQFLLHALMTNGRRVIGFDLCEVAPDPNNSADEWDLNVGARLLLELCLLVDQSP